MHQPVIAITMGDPGGIGPEVIAKSFQDFRSRRNHGWVLFGIPSVFQYLKERLRVEMPLHRASLLSSHSLKKDVVNLMDVSEEMQKILRGFSTKKMRTPPTAGKMDFDIGKVSLQNAAAAYAALKLAARAALEGRVHAIVTAPVHKSAMRLIEPGFHGHTEYLARASKTPQYAMMFVSGRLKVTLVTIHVPIRKVSGLITRGRVLEKIRLTHQFLHRYLKISKPKIAVCALNPHGRETGTEEDDQIAPAVSAAQKSGIQAHGPLSADQLFFDAYEGRYDAVISMYHDQGLAPFKMIAFRDGVNVTLGLPFIRTSPDHGTAFDIAYKGQADPSSFQAAVTLAEKWTLGTNPVH